MSGFYRSIEYIGNGINNARDTKQAIITAANSYEHIKKKVKEIEEQAWKKVEKQKMEEIHFDPNEIERIVLKKENGEER